MFSEIPADLQHPAGWRSFPRDKVMSLDKRLASRASVNTDFTYYLNAGGEHAFKAGVQFMRRHENVNDGAQQPIVYLGWDQDCWAYGTNYGRGAVRLLRRPRLRRRRSLRRELQRQHEQLGLLPAGQLDDRPPADPQRRRSGPNRRTCRATRRTRLTPITRRRSSSRSPTSSRRGWVSPTTSSATRASRSSAATASSRTS